MFSGRGRQLRGLAANVVREITADPTIQVVPQTSNFLRLPSSFIKIVTIRTGASRIVHHL
jgi:hypothetical protein